MRLNSIIFHFLLSFVNFFVAFDSVYFAKTEEIIGNIYVLRRFEVKNDTKKVVILNNFVSPYVSEAIIILRDYDPRLESKAIADAEKIVSDYIEKLSKNGQPRAARKKHGFIKYVIVALIIAAIIVFCLK